MCVYRYMYLYMYIHVHVHVQCIYMYTCFLNSAAMFMCEWGELVNHKRSLTHHLSSQGWAPGCPIRLCLYCLCVVCWFWVSFFLLFLNNYLSYVVRYTIDTIDYINIVYNIYGYTHVFSCTCTCIYIVHIYIHT